MMKMEETDIHVSLNALPPLAELAIIWQNLQAHSDHSFFISWAWINCWLEALPKDLSPLLLKAERAGRIVGMGIVLANSRPRLKLFKSSALHLNTTGNDYFDELTIEYNGFLVDRSGAPRIVAELLKFLFNNREHRCNELFIDAGSNIQAIKPIAPVGARLLVRRARGCYAVDLNALRASNQDYITTLGSTRRYNIRRSIKEYARLAPLNTMVASSVDEAVFFLKELRRLHQAYWGEKDLTGAFANPFFDAFIHRLVTTQFASGVIQLMCVSVGERPIGYLLNFVYLGHVYQYQSGFDYAVCDKYNAPGYVCHVYGVEYNLKCGHHCYDYMAGESDYKKAMGESTGELSWLVVQRDNIGFRIENQILHTARKLRHLIKNRPLLRSRTT